MLDNIIATAGFRPTLGRPSAESTTPLARITAMHPFDTYHWEKITGPTCVDGQLHETWCYIECAGGSCQTLWCEDRTVGPC
jgi:hypothetical protein